MTALERPADKRALTDQPSMPGAALGRRAVLTAFGGLLLAMLLASLDQTIVATALPTIVGELGGLQRLSWVVSAYLLTSTVSIPIWGRLGDLYGRKRVFQSTIVVFLGGSVLCGVAQDLTQLIGFRALQGLGAGGLMTLAMALVADLVSPRERGRYQGYIQGVFVLASVAGPLLGGFLVDQASWRWIFYVNLPVGAITLAITAIVLQLPAERREVRIDYLGAAFLVAALTPILVVLSSGGSGLDVTDPAVSGPLIFGTLFLAAFVWQERRAAEPIVPLQLFANPVVLVVNLALFFTTTALFAVVVFMPIFLQIVKGVTATNSGLLILPLMLAMFASTVLSGTLMTRTGRYKIFPVLGLALVTVGMFLLSTIGPDTSETTVSAFLVLFGAGFGMVSQILLVAVQNAVDRRILGTATGLTNFFRALGGTLGIALYGAVFSRDVARWVPMLVPGGQGGAFDPRMLQATPAVVRSLPPAVRDGIALALARSLDTVFLVATPIAAAALLIVLFLQEQPLRGPEELGHSAGLVRSGEPTRNAHASAATLRHGVMAMPKPQAQTGAAPPGRLARRAQIMAAINIFMRPLLRLPFATPMSRFLMLLSFTGRKTGRRYQQPVSYTQDGDVLLTPAGGRWKLNLRDGEPVPVRLRGHEVLLRPEFVRDIDEVERLVRRMVALNPRSAGFMPFVGPKGEIDRSRAELALSYGFAVIRWHFPPPSAPLEMSA